MNSVNDEPNRKEAQRQFEQELSLNPNDALSEYQIGELMWIANRPGDAIKRFLRAVELQPNFPDALIAAGKALLSTGKPDQGISLLEKAVSLDPSNEVAHYRLAQAFQKIGDMERAQKELAEFRRLRSARSAGRRRCPRSPAGSRPPRGSPRTAGRSARWTPGSASRGRRPDGGAVSVPRPR